MRWCSMDIGRWARRLLLENAGIPVPGETILLLASFLAYSEHDLQLPWIIVVATIAATLGDNLGFALRLLRRTTAVAALSIVLPH